MAGAATSVSAGWQYRLTTGNFLTPDWSLNEDHVDCNSGYGVQHPCGDTGHFGFSFFYGGNGRGC
ncbi:hypothetical protein CRG98_043949 [Punica granatum]|uniref:Uncharacterized protein n=1 Tax=Punica granatum TaxID=22663 RepID=A0A2I0HVG2_PUNGR|nr:hypothetical protein CRG98_043949 [Punica granatum]